MSKSENKSGLTYADAGVSLDRADAVSDRLKTLLPTTFRKGCHPLPGGFAGLFDLKKEGIEDAMLVMSTDGIGTKIKLGVKQKSFFGLGIDLVAMSVNDILTLGAEPLCFLDYVAFSDFDQESLNQFLEGVIDGCKQSRAALIGGETAEMPGLYQPNEFDAAGFCLGAVSKQRMLDGSQVRAGDRLIGLESSGVHSNGFSLVHAILAKVTEEEKSAWLEKLLEPTRIYVASVLEVNSKIDVHAMVHITGGGLPGNVNRVLKDGLRAVIRKDSWQPSDLFSWLQSSGQVQEEEMFRVFNMGIGFVIVVDKKEADKTLQMLQTLGERAYLIGEVVADEGATVELI